MQKEKIVKKLYKLAQLDIDATYAYEQALKNTEDRDVYTHLDEFRRDHVRHIDDLSEIIRSYGSEPPERSKDFKGYLIEGMTMIRSVTGTQGALAAMQTNEELTNRTYKEALLEEVDEELPEDVRNLIEENYEDEKRHLKYIKEKIESFENV